MASTCRLASTAACRAVAALSDAVREVSPVAPETAPDAVRNGSKSKKKPPTSIIPGDESPRWRKADGTPREAEIRRAPLVVDWFDGGESSTDASLDLSCVKGYCSPGYKECGGGYGYAPSCCGGDFPDCGQYGGCEGSSRTAWKSPSELGYPDDY